MKKLFFVSLMIFIILEAQSQVSGSVNLENETDYSGVTVSFIAQSPTAESVSTITDSLGDYSLDLNNGIYKIRFEKQGFISKYYNNEEDIFLVSPESLDNITLDKVLSEGIEISGEIDGVLSSQNTYIVKEDIVVAQNSTLEIEAGTVLRFSEGVKLTINGQLTAIGEEHNPILFTSTNFSPSHGDWDGILLNSNGNILQHSILEYCKNAVIIENQADVSYNEFRYFSGYGIKVALNSTLTIGNNYFHDFKDGTAIYSNDKLVTVECNTIENGENANGIHIDTDLSFHPETLFSKVSNNIVVNTKKGLFGFSGGEVINNYFQDNEIAIDWYAASVIHYNTLLSNNVAFHSAGGFNKVNNNIVDSSNDLFESFWGPNDIPGINEVRNNLFYNTPINKNDKIGLGTMITTNSNGDDVDTYFNLVQDPLFLKQNSPFIFSSSPTIGAGENGTTIGLDVKSGCLSNYFGNGTTQADTLSISGKITDPSNIVAYVTAINVETNQEKTVQSENDGTFKLDSLSNGKYIIKIEPLGELVNLYQTTYFPKKSNKELALIIPLQYEIINMDIRLLPSNSPIANVSFEQLVKNIEIFPNPVSSKMTIQQGGFESYEILSHTGNILMKGQIDEEFISVDALQNGVYFIKLLNKEGSTQKRFVKK